MRKLKLDTDTLRVESFVAQAAPAGEGTVHAHATPYTYCGNTCAATCATHCDCTFGCTIVVGICAIDD